MRMFKAAVVVVALGLGGSAWAQLKAVEVELPVGDTKRTLDFAASEPSVLGIKLGDSAQRVTEILEKEFGSEAMNVSQEKMGTVVDGVAEVSTNAFISGYSAYKTSERQSDSVEVSLSSPMTGSRVISIKRKLDFDGNNVAELPDYEAVKKAVLENYGPSTKVYFHSDGLQWQYEATNGKLAVRRGNCINVNISSCNLYGVGTSYLDSLESLNKKGVEVIVSALVVGFGQNTGKARRLNVELKDIGGALESHSAVFDFMTEKGEAALKDGSGAAPKIAF